ncbi:hypothetical protein DMUE_1128 [Dictyocoela muelleri]|nr:hypothetical protein DMUE_1128 [Dictyocoela muelleri]
MNKGQIYDFKNHWLNKENSNYIIFEAKSNIDIIKIPIVIDHKIYYAVMDTGATNSFISLSIAKEVPYKIKNNICRLCLQIVILLKVMGKLEIIFSLKIFQIIISNMNSA